MVRDTRWLLVTTLLLALVAFQATVFQAYPADEDTTAFDPVDLSALQWYAKQGFDPDDRFGFDPNGDGVLAVRQFPINLFVLFPIEPSRKVHHFALMTRFELADDVPPPLSLSVYRIGENWAIYLNGNLLRNEIHLNADGSFRIRRSVFGPVIPIPARFLLPGTNTLVVRMAGDSRVLPLPIRSHTRLGSRDFLIGETSEVYRIARGGFTLAVNTSFSLFGLFYLVFYFRDPRDPHPLYFSLFTILFSSYQVSATPIIGEYIADTTWLHRIRWSCLSVLAPLMALFIHAFFFRGERLPLAFRMVILFGLFFLAWFLLADFPWALAMVALWQLHIIIVTIVLVGFTIMTWMRRIPYANAMAISIILFGFFTIVDVVLVNMLVYEFRFSQVAFLGFVICMAMMITFRYMELHRETLSIRQVVEEQRDAFARFVPTPFLDLLGRNSATEIELGDNSLRPMSVLFSDIRGFTQLSETMNPQENFDFLNSYLKRVGPIIDNGGGFVDKFLGDGLMVLFAETEDRHKPADARITSADRAVRAAVDMQNELLSYNAHRRRSGYSDISIGIGINSGDVILGTVGSDHRLDTTVVGDTVNVASRLEELAATYRAGIIISDITYRQLTHRNLHNLRMVGWVVLRGKTDGVNVYEVFDHEAEQDRELKLESRPHLESALKAYRAGSIVEARQAIVQASEIHSGDPVIQAYLRQWAST